MNDIDIDIETGQAVPVRDRGGILVLVLVTGVIATLFVLPILYYVTTVARANRATTTKAEAVELAEGGTWVALNNQGALFDKCGVEAITTSLDGVTTTCEVLSIEALRDLDDVPFDSATVQADSSLPAGIGVAPFVNPNTAADPGAWITDGSTSSVPTLGKVWLPELPVRPTGSGGERDKMMSPGTIDPSYPAGSTCRVFFPGTYTSPIEIDEPAYFISGVYYFTEPIILRSGADVVVGPGEEVGCTNDFEGPSGVVGGPPIPLGASGLGGTFVLGESASIEVDDDGSGDIRFAMNPRYVSDDETSVAASAGVSIVSVNGDHGPSATLGDPLVVPGVISVPASTVGIDGSPLAAHEGYGPSVLSPKPGTPDAPTISSTVSYQRDRVGNGGTVDRGRITVFWNAPAENGSPITGYTATDATSGRSCSPAAQPGYEIQTSCTIDGITDQSDPSAANAVITVTATNAIGTSVPSAPVDASRVDLDGPDQVPSVGTAAEPRNLSAIGYPDGVEVRWEVPDSNGSPITGYRATITGQGAGGGVSTCDARWNETACVAPVPPLGPSGNVKVQVQAIQSEGSPAQEFLGAAKQVGSGNVGSSTDSAPELIPDVLPVGERKAILDFSMAHSANVDIVVGGYVSVPQGRVELSATSPATSSVALNGGVVAGEIDLDAAGAPGIEVRFDNPIGQKLIRLISTASGRISVTSTAIVQVNGSGSVAINSWVVQ